VAARSMDRSDANEVCQCFSLSVFSYPLKVFGTRVGMGGAAGDHELSRRSLRRLMDETTCREWLGWLVAETKVSFATQKQIAPFVGCRPVRCPCSKKPFFFEKH
jgi:hypothetical protein